MDYYHENGFLEELLASQSDSWEVNTITTGMGMGMGMGIDTINAEYYNYNVWSSSGCKAPDSFGENTIPIPPPCTTAAAASCYYDEYSNYLPLFDESQNYSSLTEFCSPPPPPLGDELSPQPLAENAESSSLHYSLPSSFPCSQEDLLSISSSQYALERIAAASSLVNPISSTFEPSAVEPSSVEVPSDDKKGNKSKKIHGQPSKNLMAERRRRKRLNDRLSMLRSVVPKISKMDRTSILGDTIDYMKELLERINNLQEEMELDKNEMSIFKNVKPNEMLVRNSPKFDVESRGEIDTRIEICCGGKPGLLLSTVATLDTLGLEIQQCVISCFNDFAMQASCTKELEQNEVISSEDIRQVLFINAGYGGKCF